MDTRKNILEIKNMHTYFFTDNGVVKSVDGVDIELKEGSTLAVSDHSFVQLTKLHQYHRRFGSGGPALLE